MINKENVDAIIESYKNQTSSGNFFPSVYVIEPISICNLACIMCPNSLLGKENLGVMPLDIFDRITQTISPYAEVVMLYFMGEPLMYPNFEELIQIARRNIKGKIVISTNCTFLNSRNSKAIIGNNIDILICCIDHWEKEKYEAIRIKSNFEKVVKNVEELLTIRANNVNPIVLVKSLNFGFTQIEAEKYENHWRERGAIPLIGWIDTWAGQLPELKESQYQEQPYMNITRTACADLWFKMVVNWKGEIVLCCHNYDYSIKLGRLSEGDLKSAWHSEKIIALRNSHIEGRFSCNKLCENCTEWADLKELDSYLSMNRDNMHLVF